MPRRRNRLRYPVGGRNDLAFIFDTRPSQMNAGAGGPDPH
jgi:hypothetical protein